METILSAIEEKRAVLNATADFLWDHPETAFTEFESAKYLCEVLRKEGFTVEENIAGIQTAFTGTFGSGKPVIGILGEYDALSGLSQVEGIAEQKSAGGEAGHGCGHNLLGTGSLGAAIGVKAWLEKTGKPGTVIYFGCPGEEGGSGKAFMARDGVFDGLDAAFCWHPDEVTKVRTNKSLANYQILYKFDGIASHAGGSPELGRSALDAVELMNVGVQFLREHIPSSCRIHYAITDTGGFSPNVVQPHAEVLYLIRGVTNKIAAEIYERVNDIAQGAALMTGTRESHKFIKACSNIVPNTAIQQMLQEKMEAIPAPQPTEEQIAYAREITATLGISPKADMEHPLWWEIGAYSAEGQSFGSTDVGDTSWVCPTAQIYTTCVARGTPGHSWQWTAQCKTDFARDMTIYAAKVLAAGAVELMENPELLEKAKAEHKTRVGEGYVPPIPKDVKPTAMDALRK
ncbi:MAG: amidohydrolase [Oscillospiraceae bacterium]|nr:amidohydrolase [Oscillospiraceae bacterium]